jgi:hypothetical protein
MADFKESDADMGGSSFLQDGKSRQVTASGKGKASSGMIEKRSTYE